MSKKCLTCAFAKWEDGEIVGCGRDDCENGVVNYD